MKKFKFISVLMTMVILTSSLTGSISFALETNHTVFCNNGDQIIFNADYTQAQVIYAEGKKDVLTKNKNADGTESIYLNNDILVAQSTSNYSVSTRSSSKGYEHFGHWEIKQSLINITETTVLSILGLTVGGSFGWLLGLGSLIKSLVDYGKEELYITIDRYIDVAGDKQKDIVTFRKDSFSGSVVDRQEKIWNKIPD